MAALVIMQPMRHIPSTHYPIEIQPIGYGCPLALFALFKAERGAIFLGSGLLNPAYGRYSYIGLDPFERITIKDEPQRDVAGLLKEKLRIYVQPFIPGLPPFQGGFAGCFAYEFHQYIEPMALPTEDDVHVPDMSLGLYDLVIAFDHVEEKAWIISTGYPEISVEARALRAKVRMQKVLEKIPAKVPMLETREMRVSGNFRSNFTRGEYESAVTQVIEAILAGDIFEANVSQRFDAAVSADFSSWDCYVQLWHDNPAPFSAWMQLDDDTYIVSASPERFVKVSQGRVEARPIKGTCRRGETEAVDRALAEGLSRSEKDRAENIMIVDLLRNDLSKVCEDHSVNVAQLCGVETYATVHHLVSVITGKLRASQDCVDVLWALFPGGSVTGAPKIRAMEIIASIEKRHRGIYCGSIGFLGFNGEMDLSIAIRTATVKGGRLYVQVGGAVVADSEPCAEYEETLTKAASFRKILVPEVVHDFAD